MDTWSAMSQGNLNGATNNALGVATQSQQAIPGAQAQLSSAQSNLNSYAGIDYPAMGQSGASPSPNQNAAYAAPNQQSTPDSSSRGFNPWSLQGEANSR